MLLAGCSHSNPNDYVPLTDLFHGVYKNNRIKLETLLDYDAVLASDLISHEGTYYNLIPGYDFHFFNYGEDIILTNMFSENIFLDNFSRFKSYELLKKEDVKYTSLKSSKSYGDYCKAQIISKSRRKIYDDVFVSPIAWNYLNSPESDKALLFVIFENPDDNKMKAVVYLTNSLAESILTMAPNSICTKPCIWTKSDMHWNNIE